MPYTHKSILSFIQSFNNCYTHTHTHAHTPHTTLATKMLFSDEEIAQMLKQINLNLLDHGLKVEITLDLNNPNNLNNRIITSLIHTQVSAKKRPIEPEETATVPTQKPPKKSKASPKTINGRPCDSESEEEDNGDDESEKEKEKVEEEEKEKVEEVVVVEKKAAAEKKAARQAVTAAKKAEKQKAIAEKKAAVAAARKAETAARKAATAEKQKAKTKKKAAPKKAELVDQNEVYREQEVTHANVLKMAVNQSGSYKPSDFNPAAHDAVKPHHDCLETIGITSSVLDSFIEEQQKSSEKKQNSIVSDMFSDTTESESGTNEDEDTSICSKNDGNNEVDDYLAGGDSD